MKRLFETFYEGRTGGALLVLRLVFGLAFILHGLPKVHDPAAFADKLPVPTWLGILAAWNEPVAGGLLLLGLLTPLASLLVLAQMAGAFLLVHLPHHDPFVNPAGGASFESATLYAAVGLAVFLAGPGAYSLDAVLMRRAASESAVIPRRRRAFE